jgi:hypothetical protein
MTQSERGPKEIAPFRQIVVRNNNNTSYGEIDIPPGEDIWHATRLAAKIAITEGVEVRFLFNEHPHSVTVQEAKKMLSPEEIKKEITRHKDAIARAYESIRTFENLIKEEKDLGTLLYGEGFSDTIK